MPREPGKFGPYRFRAIHKLQKQGPKGGYFFTFHGKKFYLRDFNNDGYHILSLSKNGYAQPFILKDVVFSKAHFVILEEVAR